MLGALTRRHQVRARRGGRPAGRAELARGRGDAEAVYGAAAAERAAPSGRRVTAELAGAASRSSTRPPEELAPALADRYLALKAAGRLLIGTTRRPAYAISQAAVAAGPPRSSAVRSPVSPARTARRPSTKT